MGNVCVCVCVCVCVLRRLPGKQSACINVTYFCLFILESLEPATEQMFRKYLLKQIQFPSYYLHIFVLQLPLHPKEKYTFLKN